MNARILFVMLSFCILISACKDDKKTMNGISIEKPYAFATAESATTGAAFMIIKNNAANADTLLSAESSIAEITEIHENVIDADDGTMMMRKIKSLGIPANGTTKLAPAGNHIMFLKLNQALKEKDEIAVQLNFEKAGKVDVLVPVISAGAKPAEKHMH